ncbi:hypothetical protein KQ302_02690 [Synechococcus sp. CS-602]|uniref:hypothetical protein n=1 Tax=Synechococcus sp. CS-602 TaxID=2847982 RepID=UPI00223BAE4B|nr:hypothetical protein [Synechococcus sp. CS-602]MCT0204025.1 hypothetical protein [Synechococcus sp. CS-602]
MRRQRLSMIRASAAALCGLALLSACGRHDPPEAIDLTFIVASRNQQTSKTVLATAGQRAMRFDPDTLACEGVGEYRQVGPSTDVLIRDERGDVIGSGVLGAGTVLAKERDADGSWVYRGCKFSATIPLLGPARIYTVELAKGKFGVRRHISELAALSGVVVIDLE